MSFLLCSIHFWTLKCPLQMKENDVGCIAYHEKGGTETKNETKGFYVEEKKIFTESRGLTWTVSNKRPEKLRDSLKELEDLLVAHRCIDVAWKNHAVVQIVLSNGTLAYVVLNLASGDVERISLEKYLLGKLNSDHVVDVISFGDVILFSYVEPKLTRIQCTRKASSTERDKKIEKLNSLDPKISLLDLIGPVGRRLERKLSRNMNNDLLLVWWRTSNGEVWPWTPVTIEKERANLQVYNIDGSKFDLLCYCRTEMEPMSVAFSQFHPHRIISLECKSSRKGELSIERCIYDVTVTKLQKISCASIPLKSEAVCQAHNSQDDRLLLGCQDCSLIMFDEYRKNTVTATLPFLPSIISWHPNDCLVLIASERGQIACFDQALSSIHIQLIYSYEVPNPDPILDLSDFFKQQTSLLKIVWNPSQKSSIFSHLPPMDRVVLVFDKGPLVCLHFHLGILNGASFTAVELTSQYLKHDQLDEAVKLLASLNWNSDAQLSYYCLTLVFNHLLRIPFTPSVDAHLEAVLGTFYAPARPLTKSVILEYRHRLGNLARRFFHHLLRHGKLEKASLLAVDIGNRDLFRDLYYVAMSKGDEILAEVTLRNAKELEEGSFTSDGSVDSQQSESEENDDYSDSSYSSDCSDANHNLANNNNNDNSKSNSNNNSNGNQTGAIASASASASAKRIRVRTHTHTHTHATD